MVAGSNSFSTQSNFGVEAADSAQTLGAAGGQRDDALDADGVPPCTGVPDGAGASARFRTRVGTEAVAPFSLSRLWLGCGCVVVLEAVDILDSPFHRPLNDIFCVWLSIFAFHIHLDMPLEMLLANL